MHTFIVGRGFRALTLSLAIVLASGRAPLADQETRKETETVIHWNHVTNHGSDELFDAAIVVRWSQLARDNLFAVDPAITDPFPSARGWTMMYLAMQWLEFNEIQWGRIMRQLTYTRGLGLLEAVRMFALANMANIDATVAVWHAKNFYDFWRPFHAIRLGDNDDNLLTKADPNWVSEHIVPPLQEYPSAHAIQCQAIARTLKSIFHTDRVSFATQSTTARSSNPVRSFNRLSTASRECRESRIMAGFHYRFSVNVGTSMGNRIARRIIDTQLLRR